MSFVMEKQRDALENDSRPQHQTSQPPVLRRKLDSTGPLRNSSSPTKRYNEDDLVNPGLGEKTQLDAVSCGSGHQHPGRTYAEVDINVSVDALFAFIFTDSHFFASLCERRGASDLQQERWPAKPWPISDETVHRKISYVLSTKQKLCLRNFRAYESQVSS